MNLNHMLPILGVNIDHVATLRQLRGTVYPDLLHAAEEAEAGGAQQITVHLREDRRHIQDEDVRLLRRKLKVPLNLEMAITPEMVKIAAKICPDWVCLVPEKRRELTTEGGLDLARNQRDTENAIQKLQKSGIRVSCFVEPSAESVKLSADLGADAVELHTGRYCLAKGAQRKAELARISRAGLLAHQLRLHVHAGHGFDYLNLTPVLGLMRAEKGRGHSVIKHRLFEEYNIGHSIVCRSVFVGMRRAVEEMVAVMRS